MSPSVHTPGRGFIEEVQDFLLHFAGPDDLEEALISELDDFNDLAADLFYGFRAPFLELLVQSFS